MKITNVTYWAEQIPLSRPYTVAYKTQDSMEIIFVRLDGENGYFGVGAASPSKHVTGETHEATKGALAANLEEICLKQDIRFLPTILRKATNKLPDTPAAQAAIDIALHDLWAKSQQLPLVELLGRVHHTLPTSITIGIKDTIQESIEEAKEYLHRRFKIIKLKIGLSLEKDIETTYKIKEAVGNNMLIRVDANQGYTGADLLKYWEETRVLDVEFVEQPFKPKKVNEMLAMPKEIRDHCAGDESVQKPVDALKYANRPHPYGIYNIKLMKCGGIAAGRQIADIAHLGGIALMWGCMDESCVSISAALHAAFASPNTRFLDLDGSFDLARDPFKGGFVIEDGMMRLTDKAGLGVEMV